jgi:hypothetical protein
MLTHLLAFVLGLAAGWLAYRNFGAKAEAARRDLIS